MQYAPNSSAMMLMPEDTNAVLVLIGLLQEY